jgi:hypothetical protein
MATRRTHGDLERFFESLTGTAPSWFLSERDIRLIRKNPADVSARCWPLIDGTHSTAALRATVVLLALGESPNLDVLEDGLLSADGRRSVTAAEFAKVTTRGQSDALLRLCEDLTDTAESPFVVNTAVKAAITLRGAATARELDALTRSVDRGHRTAIGLALCHVIDHSRDELRTAALGLFERCLDGEPRGQFDVAFFAERADLSHAPRLWRVIAEKPAPDFTGERHAALKGLTRLKAPGIRDTLLSELDVDHSSLSVLELLKELLEGSNDQEAIASLVERAKRVSKGSYHERFFAQTIAAIGGPETLPIVEELIADIPDHLTVEVRLEARGLTLAQALDELQAGGLLSLEQRRTLSKTKPARHASLAEQILVALESAGALLRFDAEFSGTPVPHDRLLVELARLAPELVVTDVAQQGPLPAAEQQAYSLTFQCARTRYELQCGDSSDWYDHDSVASILNRALADMGEQKRFVRIGRDDQYPRYMCASPAAIAHVEKKGLLTPYSRR